MFSPKSAHPYFKMLRIFVLLSVICVISGRRITGLPKSVTDINDIYQWSTDMYEMIDGYQNATGRQINLRLLSNVRKSSHQLYSLVRRIKMGCTDVLGELLRGLAPSEYELPEADICSNMNSVNRIFEESRKYALVESYGNGTIGNFEHKTLWSDKSLPDLLDDIRISFTADRYSTGLLDLLHEYSMQSLQADCDTQASMQQRLYYMYTQLILTELKGLLTLQQIYLRERSRPEETHNYVAELDYARRNFETRVKKYHDTFIQNVDRFPQYVRRCDAKEPKYGDNIFELNNFSRYRFLPSLPSLPCRSIPSGDELHEVSKLTGYSIYNCDSMSYSAKACPAEPGSRREYRWWRDYDDKLYGHDSPCLLTQIIRRDSSSWCKVSACSMDQQQIKPYYNNATWRINVEDQIADVLHNMVVTGVKFVIDDNTLYLQIHQSNFSYDGLISHKSAWKSSQDDIGSDKISVRPLQPHTEALSHNRKTIYLDDVVVPEGHVVIGVRLQPAGDSAFALQILASSYHFKSGKLDLSTKQWYGADSNQMRPRDYQRRRMVINLDGSDDPMRVKAFDYDLSSNKEVTFTHTDKYKDAGQTTIPLLDAQPVITDPAYPLKGIGLSFKGKPGFGGYVTPRIFTIDMFHHMKTLTTVVQD